jgi:DNA-binding NtrC family response regulator
VIFSARRKTGNSPRLGETRPAVLIESHDSVFAEKIARTIDQWGITILQFGDSKELELLGRQGGVVVLDIRELGDDAFGQVYFFRQRYPGSEVVLINRPDNVVASIAGMKAGAVDEIIVPLDTGMLQKMITEAHERVEAARGKKTKKPLLTRFSEAMMAATFAQAGDFEGALDLLERPEPKRNAKSLKKKD